VAEWMVDWQADGQFTISADSYDEALEKADDIVRDYLDPRQLGGGFAIFVEEYKE